MEQMVRWREPEGRLRDGKQFGNAGVTTSPGEVSGCLPCRDKNHSIGRQTRAFGRGNGPTNSFIDSLSGEGRMNK